MNYLNEFVTIHPILTTIIAIVWAICMPGLVDTTRKD